MKLYINFTKKKYLTSIVGDRKNKAKTAERMFSFRFLNRHLVDKYPYQGNDICYLNPDIICKDLPPNRLRFLGTW